jgi:hypothetical protein
LKKTIESLKNRKERKRKRATDDLIDDLTDDLAHDLTDVKTKERANMKKRSAYATRKPPSPLPPLTF